MDELIDAEEFLATFFECPAPDSPTMEELSVINTDHANRITPRSLLLLRDFSSSYASFGGNR